MSRILKIVLLSFTLLALTVPACTPASGEITGYVGIVPKVLHSGAEEAISFSLFAGDARGTGTVEVSLVKDGENIAHSKGTIRGTGTLKLNVPDLEEGKYQIEVKGAGFHDSAEIKVEKDLLVFVETDKPIYKPGQTLNIRVITVDSNLKPVSGAATVNILDAKGIKIFRSELQTDDYGMATTDLPISEEPNLGVWKINAESSDVKTQIDVRVEEYVLPKYEVKVEMAKEWFLVTEPLKGSVQAEYSFGKPVTGELIIKASRYVGQWEEYASYTKVLDGQAEFEVPAVGYVAGVPSEGGLGNVMLDISVKESATGYEEKTTEMLTISKSPLNIQIIPESILFKPGLPLNCLIITETPDKLPLEKKVHVTLTYLDDELNQSTEEKDIQTSNGKGIFSTVAPDGSIALIIEASAEDATASRVLEAGYSPSGSFIHIEQESDGIPSVGGPISFKVNSTNEARNFYYEVIARGRTLFTGLSRTSVISFRTTPEMAPSSKLLVYQILPNSEVAADYIPFKVESQYPQNVSITPGQEEVRPGDNTTINIQTEGESKVGIAAVDKSVYILAGNRLNLQQVFDELERLYMQPQAELHDFSLFTGIETNGASEVFDNAGVVVLTNNKVPEGKQYKEEGGQWGGVVWLFGRAASLADSEAQPPSAGPKGTQVDVEGLAQVQRVRQYFPETWLWQEVMTGADGKASLEVEVPDTITTWMLRAVALSREKGLGVADGTLKTYQPFFVKIDLPYSAIRGEEFPVRVAIYNYLDEPQSVLVELDGAEWFDLLDEPANTVEIAANEVGAVEFKISPKQLGVQEVKITARSKAAADAVVKTLIIEPEGIAKELVENIVLSNGASRILDTSIPPSSVQDSGRAYVAITSSYLTQTLEGLEGLIQMPFGCGEQNMIVFAPDVYITRYLTETGQLKPEIMAKAEKLMITGYQRELTYRHNDGSFSAFGESDQEGSLFLTAFVLKSFSQANELIYIDENILSEAEDWIISHQNADGSFDPVGFVSHTELMGGLDGKATLTAYVAIALLEAGEQTASGKAIGYLEGELDRMEGAYETAITAYALELAGSPLAGQAYQKLMDLAQEDENGIHWGDIELIPEPLPQKQGFAPAERFMPPEMNRSTAIEATGYAALALIKQGDAFNASRAAKWLVSQRNAYGGFGSTQDTVIGLQALTEYSTEARSDVDLKVNIEWGAENRQLTLTQQNFDVLQVIDVPVDSEVTVSAQGKGDAIVQMVRRFSLPEAEEQGQIFELSVDYDSTDVEVNDTVKVTAELEFSPPVPMEAEMVVLDISVPTGFAALKESVEAAVNAGEKIKRYDIAGRKVIFYLEGLKDGDRVSFSFDVVALYPVKAKGVESQAYSYYSPDLRAEVLGAPVVVR